jgi:HEAT repeat protein
MPYCPEIEAYLRSLVAAYEQWWEHYTLTDAIQLTVQTISTHRAEERSPKKIEQFPVLEGIRKYAPEHVLLSGKPGSGKSTALKRLLLEEANRALQGQVNQIPVWVELRAGKPIVILIQDSLRRHRWRQTVEQIDQLLFDSKLLLLVDGLNEIASDELLRDLEDFRANNAATPIIFTTRDLGIGGDLGIANKLEMQPLTEPQIREFIHRYLPEQSTELLRQLKERLRELGETPLLLKMLCDVFSYAQIIPQNKGELFRWFDREYDQFKRLESISGALKRWKSELLQYLAFRMVQGKDVTQFQLQITRSQAEKLLEELLRDRIDNPAEKAKEWLEGLLEHHLLQFAADRTQIEFHHQLFQEYYAAEYLLNQLSNLSDATLKREYLNYLKWTEPIALMLGLSEDEAQVLQIIRLALDVDLRLGAKLAGAVKREFQPQTVCCVHQLPDVGEQLRVELLGETQSDAAIPFLLLALEDNAVRWRLFGNMRQNSGRTPAYIAADALSTLGSEQAIIGLHKALEHENHAVRKIAAHALEQLNRKPTISDVLEEAQDRTFYLAGTSLARALNTLDNKQILPSLLETLEEILREWDLDFDACDAIADVLKKFNSREAIVVLLQALEDEENDNNYILSKAAYILGKLGEERAIPQLLKVALENSEVPYIAAEALGLMGSPKPLQTLWRAYHSISEDYLRDAIAAIQSRCKFYNYEIFQSETIAPENPSLRQRTILFLAASPTDRDRSQFQQQVREIEEGLRRSQHRDRFELEQRWAVRPDDLRRALLDFSPQIVHFCGYGEGIQGLVLEHESGNTQLVTTEAIADLFQQFPQIECVVFNACYSDEQAEAIVRSVPYVIGMSDALPDQTALKFAQGFYDALGAGQPYESAYEFGKNAIALEGISGESIPKLYRR